MPILTLQKSFRELGRIRLGHRSAKGAPAKLECFRLTSASRELLDVAALLYGGKVKAWAGAPNEGTWELYTDTSTLDIMVPPGQAITQWFEQWTAGGCQRRCDGITEQLSDSGCLCPADHEERREQAQKGLACHMVTRLNVILPRVPDVGVWRLESRGFYSATEIPGTIAIFDMASTQGRQLPARLRIDQRVAKRPGKPPSRYVVPVIELAVSVAELTSGEPGEHRALPSPAIKQLSSPSTKVEAPGSPSPAGAEGVAATFPSGAAAPDTPDWKALCDEAGISTVALLKWANSELGIRAFNELTGANAARAVGWLASLDGVSKQGGSAAEAFGEGASNAGPTPPEDSPPLTAMQMRKLLVLAKSMGWDDERRHAEAGVGSFKALTKRQASDLIDKWGKQAEVDASWK